MLLSFIAFILPGLVLAGLTGRVVASRLPRDKDNSEKELSRISTAVLLAIGIPTTIIGGVLWIVFWVKQEGAVSDWIVGPAIVGGVTFTCFAAILSAVVIAAAINDGDPTLPVYETSIFSAWFTLFTWPLSLSFALLVGLGWLMFTGGRRMNSLLVGPRYRSLKARR